MYANALHPYPTYHPSGVEWLGDVPTNWEMRRFKYLLQERDDRSADGSEQLLRVSQFSGVTERKRVDGGEGPDTRAASLVGYKCVRRHDLVVNIMLAWNGSLGISQFHGIASPAYCVYQFLVDAYPWFFHYLLRSQVYRSYIKTASTGVVDSRLRLYTDDLYQLYAPLPPLPEQAAIVRYLDHADRRIRRYVGAKQKLIALLEEEKQAVINQAVTRGLDPNVPLKPSGVDWLGDVTMKAAPSGCCMMLHTSSTTSRQGLGSWAAAAQTVSVQTIAAAGRSFGSRRRRSKTVTRA